jgi:cell division protein FtsB
MSLRRIAVLLVGIVLLVGLASLTNVIPFSQILEQQQAVEAAAAQLTALQAENSRMVSEVEALQTPGEIERLIREKLGYVNPGEVGFVVFEPEPEIIRAPANQTETTPRPAWYLRIWDFLTGADLGADERSEG